MSDSDSRLGFVNVLTACARGTVGIYLKIIGIDIYFNVGVTPLAE